METLQNGRTDPWYMLDNAETCIKALAEQATPVADLDLPGGADGAQTVSMSRDTTVALVRAPNAQGATLPAYVEPAADPHFLELFIEEVREEIAAIQQSFPQWDQNPMDLESLSVLQRSFHTLKGSGRMVDARLIAEFGWSIENLLNRIIDKTLSRTPDMMALLRSAVAALPQLVEQLETGRQIPVPVNDIMAGAFAYAEGRPAKGTAGTDGASAGVGRGRAAGARSGAAGARSRAAGARTRAAGARSRAAGARSRAAGARSRAAGARSRAAGARTRAAALRSRAAGARSRAAGVPSRVAGA
jgi:chemosensory pili system protein ChpA (sensor histidine kinase/response regulator)